MKSIGYLLFALMIIYLGYDIYSTGVISLKGMTHNLSYQEKTVVSLIFILVGLRIIYLILKKSK
jgi:hypothetical protein